MQLFKLGGILAVAQTISATQIHIKNTSPPANRYVHHCTVIVDEPGVNGCDGSSSPFEDQCGRNPGVLTQSICNGGEVKVNWYTGEVTVKKDGKKASCVLSDVHDGGECDTEKPDQYEKGDYNGASGLGVSSALYGLAPLVAAGLML